ncbi:MAG: DUF7133 domain-containing protein, partial [Phycisphaerales bacterium]
MPASRSRLHRPAAILASAAACAAIAPGHAQNGDVRNEAQPDVISHLEIPEAPVLSPAEAHAAFELLPGFRVDLVAAEPLVEDPVSIAFDESGRRW